MNIHDDFESLVDPYLFGGLEPAERKTVEMHVDACSVCALSLTDAREFSNFLQGALESMKPPVDLEERLISGLRTEGFGASKRRLRIPSVTLPVWSKFAAAALVCIAVGMFFEMRPMSLVPGRAAVPHTRDEELGKELASLVESENPSHSVEADDVQAVDKKGKFRSAIPPAEKPAAGPAQTKGGPENRRSFGRASGGGGGPPSPESPAPDPAAGEMAKSLHEVLAPHRDLKIIRNGRLDFEVEAWEAAARRVAEIVKEDGGYIATSSTQKLANGKIRGQIVLRVPAENFGTTIEKLRALGDLKNQSITTQDVTKEYVDLDSRLQGKKTLAERLHQILKEGKGEMKDLLQVEMELGKVREEIEKIQGELKYYDNLISLSTITLVLAERDIGQPFEYVQTLGADVGITVQDAEAAYARAHEVAKGAQGRILDARMSRDHEGRATGFIKIGIDADRFPTLHEELKKLGHVTCDKVERQQQAVGGQQGKAGADAPVRKEQAILDLTLTTPAVAQTVAGTIAVENADATGAYDTARKAVQDAGGKILGGGMTNQVDGATGTIEAEVEAAKFPSLVETLKKLGEVKQATVEQKEPAKGDEPRREMGRLSLRISTPRKLVRSDEGLGALFRNAVSGAIRGILWSLEMLVVGAAYVGPWLLLAVGIFVLYRRARRSSPGKPV